MRFKTDVAEFKKGFVVIGLLDVLRGAGAVRVVYSVQEAEFALGDLHSVGLLGFGEEGDEVLQSELVL